VHAGVTSVTAVYRVHGIEHRDVHNSHRATGTARPKLFTEDSGVAGWDWSVIETGGINRDLIPTMQNVERSARRDDRQNRRRSALKTRPEFLAKASVRPGGKRRVSEREQKKKYWGFFHAVLSRDGARGIRELHGFFREIHCRFTLETFVSAEESSGLKKPCYHRGNLSSFILRAGSCPSVRSVC
jgi:hypothetical protein